MLPFFNRKYRVKLLWENFLANRWSETSLKMQFKQSFGIKSSADGGGSKGKFAMKKRDQELTYKQIQLI